MSRHGIAGRRGRGKWLAGKPLRCDTARMGGKDPYLLLEDRTGEDALEWVRARNAETTSALTGGAGFGDLRRRLREVLDADEKIPYVTRSGGYLYNFWRDAVHPRGLWRRTTPERYRAGETAWEVLIDLDALAREEDENWVWQSAAILRPGHHRALVLLSRGGATRR